MARQRLVCPAAAEAHPVLSLNRADIHCQIGGHMRPAEGSPCVNPGPGVGCYTNCSLWKVARDLEFMGQGNRVAAIRKDMPADLSGAGMKRAA